MVEAPTSIVRVQVSFRCTVRLGASFVSVMNLQRGVKMFLSFYRVAFGYPRRTEYLKIVRSMHRCLEATAASNLETTDTSNLEESFDTSKARTRRVEKRAGLSLSR